MPLTSWKLGTNVTVFTLGGSSYIGELTECEVSSDIQTWQGRGIADFDSYPVPVAREFIISGEMMLSGSVTLMGTANSMNPLVSFSYNTGSNNYAGTAVISQLGHRAGREVGQTVRYSLTVRGTMVIT